MRNKYNIETIVMHKHNYEIYESISDTLHIKNAFAEPGVALILM